MVGPDQLRNAISINSSVFQLAALIGPAISGALLSAVGAGYAFAVNAASYVAPLTALLLMRDDELITSPRTDGTSRRASVGLRYVADRPQLLWPIVLVGLFGMFTSNLPVTLAVYAKTVLQSGPGGYGLLNSVVAIGSLGGALVSTRRTRARLRELVGTCLILATLEMLAAAAPDRWSYCLFLVAVGAATLLLYTSANSMVQLAADDSIRGRVMGVYLVVFIGGGALGGPLLGSIDQHFGPRVGMLLAGAVPAMATVLVALKLAHDGRLRVRLRRRGPVNHLVAIVHR